CAGYKLAALSHDHIHRAVPCRSFQPALPPYQGARQAVGMRIRFPTVQPFGPQTAAIDGIIGASTHADDLAIADADIEAATMRTQHACRLHPTFRLFLHAHIDALWPGVFAFIWRARSPNIGNAVACLIHQRPRSVWLSSIE